MVHLFYSLYSQDLDEQALNFIMGNGYVYESCIAIARVIRT